jgi:glycosyltransferase involved in cell wall biosynthesis
MARSALRSSTPEAPAADVDASALRVAYFFTRFPHPTETFLQREVRGMWRLGLKPQIHSFHAGAPLFDGQPVRQFSKLQLLALPWYVALEWWRRPRVVAEFAALLFTGWPRDWLNYWENLYGAGVGVTLASRLRRSGIQHVHAAWSSLPAMAAWVVARLNGITFSTGAHAYDLFEHGGDWFLREKCAAAAFVHTSTGAGQRRLLALGVPAGRVVLARRGLDRFPEWRPLRAGRRPLRVVCVARLVEKKGLLRQVGIYRRLRALGVDLEVKIIGDGPLRDRLEREIAAAGLREVVTLSGHLEQTAVWAELARADVLVHTGVVTASGDRDGLPNVVPEAMAAGVLVVTARGEGVMEAITHGRTGLVCDLDCPEEWHAAFVRLRDDDALAEHLRSEARAWVEENFDAARNAAKILARFAQAIDDRQSAPAFGSAGDER